MSPTPEIVAEFATVVTNAQVAPVPKPERVTEKSSAPKDGRSLS